MVARKKYQIKMKDFSQSGEQKIILNYFGDRKGAFLDCGANDGVVLSNTRALAELSWKGICIEPSPSAFEKLRWNYFNNMDVTVVNAAITTADGPIDLYDSGTHLKKGDVALLSTTVPSEMDRWKKSGEVFTKTTVRGITFQTLLSECGLVQGNVIDYTDKIPPVIAQFDFISIDAEGMDVVILRQIDLTAVGCQLLCIEFNQNRETEAAIRAHCQYHGMKLLHKNYENLIFER